MNEINAIKRMRLFCGRDAAQKSITNKFSFLSSGSVYKFMPYDTGVQEVTWRSRDRS